MPLFENHVGVSLSKSKLRLVELVYSDDEFLLENVDEEEFEEDLTAGSFGSASVDVLHSCFKELISRKNPQSKYISFSLDPEFFDIYEIPYESTLLKNDLTDQFKWELGKIKPTIDPDEYLIQHIELKNEFVERPEHAAVLFLHKNILREIKAVVSNNSLELKFIDYAHTSANIFQKFFNQSIVSDGLSVYKSDSFLSLIILQDSKPACILKEQYKEEEFEESLKKLMNKSIELGADLNKIAFSLFSANKFDSGKFEDIKDSFGLELQLINPFEVIKPKEGFIPRINQLDNPSRFAASAGVALRLF